MKRLLITMILLLAVLLPLHPTSTKAEQVVKQPITKLSLPAKILLNGTVFDGTVSKSYNSTPYLYETVHQYGGTGGFFLWFPKNKSFRLFIDVYHVSSPRARVIIELKNYKIELSNLSKRLYIFDVPSSVLSLYILNNKTYYSAEGKITVIEDVKFYYWGIQNLGEIIEVNMTIYTDKYIEALENITTRIIITSNETVKIEISNDTYIGTKMEKVTYQGQNTTYNLRILSNTSFMANISIKAISYYEILHPCIRLDINPSENLTVNTTIVFSIKISKGSFDVKERRFILWFNGSLVYNTSISSSMEISYTPRSKGIVEFLVLAEDVYGFNTTISGELYIEVKPQVNIMNIDVKTLATVGGGLGGLALLYLTAKEIKKRKELGGEELIITQ